MEDPQSGFQIFHTTWTAVITVAGGIVAFFTKRLVDQVDQKADKSDVTDLKQDIREFMQAQAEQHKSNTGRLDQIIMELGRRQ
jgi:hypothetical protein